MKQVVVLLINLMHKKLTKFQFPFELSLVQLSPSLSLSLSIKVSYSKSSHSKDLKKDCWIQIQFKDKTEPCPLGFLKDKDFCPPPFPSTSCEYNFNESGNCSRTNRNTIIRSLDSLLACSVGWWNIGWPNPRVRNCWAGVYILPLILISFPV